jgi:predicted N-acetyltransferase YhbS
LPVPLSVPDEGFIVMILNKSSMTGVSGVAKYRSEFDDAKDIKLKGPEPGTLTL